jgi:heterodisulfide reductase subunit B1
MKSDIPAGGYYLFKSCVTGSVYPGIEKSIRYSLDKLGISYTDDPEQSSCTGFGYHAGVVPLRTNVAINARNLSLAASSKNKNVLCTCPTSYGNLKECREMLSKSTGLADSTKEVLKMTKKPYDLSPRIDHVSEALLVLLEKIKEHSVHSFKGIKAVTHHGCHYSKIFYREVASGSGERPTVLDDIAKGLGCEILEYEERSLCCGMGFHHTIIDREYPRAVLKRKFSSISAAKPDVIITQCPGCTFNLDYYQERISNDTGIDLDIPVLYISEMVALALGASPVDIGLDMHAVPVEPVLIKAGIMEA